MSQSRPFFNLPTPAIVALLADPDLTLAQGEVDLFVAEAAQRKAFNRKRIENALARHIEALAPAPAPKARKARTPKAAAVTPAPAPVPTTKLVHQKGDDWTPIRKLARDLAREQGKTYREALASLLTEDELAECMAGAAAAKKGRYVEVTV